MRVISGGYWFVRSAERPSYAAADVLPPLLWTPTSCICELYPDYWAFSWCKPPQDEIDAVIRELGLSRADLQILQAWVETQFDHGGVGFPGIFLRLDIAKQFETRFIRTDSDIKLLGIGLPEAYVEEFLSEARPSSGEEPPGIYQAIESRTLLTEGGVSLGFEPLGYEYGEFHSFICNSLEEDYTKALNLSLNAHGRFTDLDACEQAIAYTRLDSTGAEPALWQPWLVVEYLREIA